MRVLLGEISSYKAIVIARYIYMHYPDVTVIAYDKKPLIDVCHTKYVASYIHIRYDSIDSYILRLAECVKQNNIDVFLPVHSDYIGHFLQKKHLFGDSLNYMGEYENYIQLHEKNKLMQLAVKIGIRIPRDYSSIQEAKIPFVIKPTNLSSAKGVCYYTTEMQKSTVNVLPVNSICQEYISGKGCGYEVYCKNGKIISEYGHMRLAEWPISGGSSVLRKGFIHSDMRPIAEKILEYVPWTGFVMFEFKLTDDNQLVLIEVNPRIWGSINQALQNDCPLFSAIIGAPKSVVYKGEVRTCLTPQVWMSMLLYLLKGKVDIIKDFLLHFKITYSDVSIWCDPRGVLSMLIRKLL